jgi:dCTP deaminase
MVLSGNAIKRGVEVGRIQIDPFNEDRVEAAHVNLHLAEHPHMRNGLLVVRAGEFIVARTIERVKLPDDICGILEGRSRLAQKGLSIEQSSTFIEPGSDTTMALEIFNAGGQAVSLETGQKVAKMVLMHVIDDY